MQNNKIIVKSLLSMSSPAFIASINFTDTVQDVLKGILLSKALTCMKSFLYKQNWLFIKETDTFGHIVVRTIIHLT